MDLGNIAFYLLQFAVFIAIALCVGVGLGFLIWGGAPLDAGIDLQLADESEVVADLRAQVEARDTEITRLRKRLKRAHADLEARGPATGDQADVAVLVQAHRDELGALNQELATVTDELDEARRELVALRSRAAYEGSLPGPADHDVSALIEELDAARAERRRLESDLLAVRASLDEQLQQAGVLGQAVAEADETASELVRAEAEIGALRDRAERSAAALSRAEAELERLRQELAELRAEHDGTVASVEQSAEQSAANDLAWARLQAELERSRANVAAWRDRLSTAEDEAERLAGELAEALARLERVQAVAVRGDARVAEVQALLDAADDELHHTRAELDLTRSDLEASRAELHAARLDLDRSSADLDRLQRERDEEQAQRAELDALRRSAASDRDEIELLHRDLQQARADSDRQLQTLHLELSDARLRADEAHEALAELAAEFTSFRDSVLRQQSTVSNLAARLDRARGVLGGRTPEAMKGPALFAPVFADEPDDLGALPGATDDFVGALRELGVASYEEIGSWDAQQLERYEDALGDVDGIMRANGWVMAARRLWEERTGSSWSDRGQRR